MVFRVHTITRYGDFESSGDWLVIAGDIDDAMDRLKNHLVKIYDVEDGEWKNDKLDLFDEIISIESVEEITFENWLQRELCQQCIQGIEELHNEKWCK